MALRRGELGITEGSEGTPGYRKVVVGEAILEELQSAAAEMRESGSWIVPILTNFRKT